MSMEKFFEAAASQPLLSPNQERDLAWGLVHARTRRLLTLAGWPSAVRALSSDALDDADASLTEAPDAQQLEILRACKQDGQHEAFHELPWRTDVIAPYATELRYRYRRVQGEGKSFRQRCLFAGGMSRRYFERRAPEDLTEPAWLEQALADEQIDEQAFAFLREEQSQLAQRIDGLTGDIELTLQALRTLYKKLRAAEQDIHLNRNTLIERNLRLVISVARKFQHRGVALEDLVQEGSIGLLRAVDRFDVSRGFKLSTYATWWIRQAVSRCVLEQSRTVRLPEQLQHRAYRVQQAMHSILQRVGREATAAELAAETGLTQEMIREVAEFTPAFTYEAAPDQALPIEQLMELGSANSGTQAADDEVEDWAANVQLRRTLRKAIARLPEAQADVVRARFGFDTRRDHTLGSLAQEMGLTVSVVRRLEREALAKLAHELHDYASLLDY